MTQWLLRASIAFYRLLLLRFPRELRRRYGDEMVALFHDDLLARHRTQGVFGIIGAWRRALRDLLRKQPRPLHPVHDEIATAPLSMDLRFALGALRRAPSFTLTMTSILGAAIAFGLAAFAVINAYLVKPLPYPEPERLVDIRSSYDVLEVDTEGVLETLISWDLDAFTLIGDPAPEVALGAWVTSGFLEAYGVRTALGRTFTPEESRPGGPAAVLISNGLWQERYGGSPDVLGRVVRAYTSDRPNDAESFTVVGVLPAGFWHFNRYTEILAPLRQGRGIYAGRLAAGLSADAAAALLTERVRARITAAPPEFSVRVVSTHEAHVAEVRPTLMALAAATLLVFFIACANAAVLLMVRSAGREQELGIRQALGAGRTRLTRQLILEGGVLAGLAGMVGALLGWFAIAGLRTFSGVSMWGAVPGGTQALRPDLNVGIVLAALTLGVAVLFSCVPLLAGRSRTLRSTLGRGGRGGGETRTRRRARSVMVGVEIAFSLALLSSAALLLQSAIHLQRLDPGFDPQGVFSGEVGLRLGTYLTPESRIQFFERLKTNVTDLPAVERAAVVSTAPFTARFGTRGVESEGGSTVESSVFLAGDDYFETMRIPLLRGRGFQPDDALGSPPVALVSEALADQMWPSLNPIGRRLRRLPFGGASDGEPERWATVVGVVGDIQKDVGGPTGDLYLAYTQSGPLWMNLVVRFNNGVTPPRVRTLEDIIAAIDPNVPLSDAHRLSEAAHSARGPSRFLATVFAAFAGLALTLATFGLFAVMSHVAGQSRRAIAIRVAVGASEGKVKAYFLKQTAVVVASGLAAGLIIARLLAGTLQGQLHGIEPGDRLTMAAVAILLGLTSGAAALIPIRRALRTPPMDVLCEE